MKKPAQEIVQHVDQQTTDLHKSVAGNVQQITGRPTTPASLNPADESILEQISDTGRDLARVGGQTLEELTTGSTYVGETASKKPSAIRRSRIARLFGRVIGQKEAA